MKASRLARVLLWTLASLALLAALVVLDWYPTVRELSRLRRERSDLLGKIKSYDVTASGFVFPDTEEKKHLRASRGFFDREVPWLEDDAAWLNECTESLRRQAEKDRLTSALLLFPAVPGGKVEPAVRLTGQGPAPDWLAAQMPWMQKGLNEASPGRFPWKSLFSESGPMLEPLASQPLAVVIAAPLPALLNFINHCTWNMRLEIVRLRLDADGQPARAWLACRSSYRVRARSPWIVPLEPGGAGGGLLVDPDSPLLWQRVVPVSAYQVGKVELPPASGARRD
ncbi:MAG TPA: hypothetical protein VF451_06465 [Acidobacteriota bacterium]